MLVLIFKSHILRRIFLYDFAHDFLNAKHDDALKVENREIFFSNVREYKSFGTAIAEHWFLREILKTFRL